MATPDNTIPHPPAPNPVKPEPADAAPIAVVALEDLRGGSGITGGCVSPLDSEEARPVPSAPPAGRETQPTL